MKFHKKQGTVLDIPGSILTNPHYPWQNPRKWLVQSPEIANIWKLRPGSEDQYFINPMKTNNVLLVIIEGLVRYTIYHHLPVVKGVNNPLY